MLKKIILTLTCLMCMIISLCACTKEADISGTWYKIGIDAEEWIFSEDGDIKVNNEVIGTYSEEDGNISIVCDDDSATAVYNEETDEITGAGYILVRSESEAESRGIEEFESEKILIEEELQDTWVSPDGQRIVCDADRFTLNDISYTYAITSDHTLLLSHDENDTEATFKLSDNTLTIDYGAGEISFNKEKKP